MPEVITPLCHCEYASSMAKSEKEYGIEATMNDFTFQAGFEVQF
jgi:hypothetical protein